MGIMLVYDITNEKSFDNIKNWIRNIEEHASADVEKMILGNKCDMNDRRQVCPYFYLSQVFEKKIFYKNEILALRRIKILEEKFLSKFKLKRPQRVRIE